MSNDDRELAWVENIEDALDALEGWAAADYLDRHPAHIEREAFLRRLELLAARLSVVCIHWGTKPRLPR
jgi:hypothetical protein